MLLSIALVLAEPPFPVRKLVGRNGKGHMNRAAAIVRRNGAAGQDHRLQRRAALKQKKHAATADIEGNKSRIAGQPRKPEHILVEGAGAREVIDIERSLDHTGQFRQRNASPHIEDEARLVAHSVG